MIDKVMKLKGVVRGVSCLFIGCVAFGVMNVYGHSRWVVPSHTILSGDKAESISFDFSISNDIFHPDMAYGGMDISDDKEEGKSVDPKNKMRKALMKKQFSTTKVVVTYPDGHSDDTTPFVNLARKSSAALLLEQSGTYRISVKQQPMLITMYEKDDGTRSREFGSKKDVKPLLPKGAKNIKTFRVHSRVETYVTRNDLTTKSLKAEGKGLELVAKSHPNELFSGEPSKFQLLLNGKPVEEGIEVKLTRNDTRYRNQRNVMTIKTQEKGFLTVPWAQAGMYLLESDMKIPGSDKSIDMEIYSFYITLEVNPE